MKFLCDSCNTKYSISDERVRGRVLKIRCKKCDFVITVREDVGVQAAVHELPPDDEIRGAFDAAAADDKTTVGDLDSLVGTPGKKPAAPVREADDWYVSFDGEQEGPFGLAHALERVRAEKSSDKEAHAWRPGFLVWLPVAEVPELASALGAKLPSLPARPAVRASTPTPIGTGRPGIGQSGAVSAHIAKDPSGPRAALGVSAGARPSAPGLGSRKSAPPIPLAAKGGTPATGLPPRRPSGSFAATSNGDTRPASKLDRPALAASPSKPAPSAAAAAVAPAPASRVEPETPDLVIANEASGLVSIERLAAAAMGKPTGPVMINGHTGRQPALPAAEPLDHPDLSMSPVTSAATSATTSAPIVVVAGAAPSGTSHHLFKWAALVALVACIGLGGGVWYLLTHRPPPDTIIVTEPVRRGDDTPITVTDPATARPEAKKTLGGTLRKVFGGGGNPKPAAPQAQGKALSGSQKALADLYKDDGDRATPRDITASARPGAQGGGQVSQSAILAVVTANRRALNLCYERVLKHDSSLKQGRVVTQVNVGISGRVSSVTIPDPQYANSELGQCFVQAVKRWNFPASDAPYATEFPFILQGQ